MSKSFKFTQDCEINNIEFKKGDIIGNDQGIGYFSDVMTTVDEAPTISLQKTTKVNIEKIEAKQASDGAESNKNDISKLRKDELVALATSLEVEVVDEDTKASLIEKIEAKQAETAENE